MKCKRIAAATVAGVLLVAGSLTTAAGAAATSSSARAHCLRQHDDPWPAWTQGRPTGVDPQTAAGVYMWHDAKGWHIRAKHSDHSQAAFTGTLVTAGRFVGVNAVRLEHRDAFTVSRDHRVVRFRFDNHGYIDGINFRTLCAPSITFSFGLDGARVAPDQVTIGHGSAHPSANPFVITRR